MSEFWDPIIARLPQQPAEAKERFAGVTYGRSPCMQALDDLKAWDALPPEMRAKAVAEFYREHPELLRL